MVNRSGNKTANLKEITKNIKSHISRIKRKEETEDSVFDRFAKKNKKIVEKPRVDMLILRILKDNESNEISVQQIAYFKDSVFITPAHMQGYEDSSYYYDIDLLGVQVDHASVYGKTAEVSLSEESNWMFQNIKTSDIVLINTYLDSDEDEIDLIKYAENKDLTVNGLLANLKKKIDFTGLITIKEKNVTSTEQFRFEAVDILRILQQINIPVGVDNAFIETRGERGIKKNYLETLFLNAFFSRIATQNYTFVEQIIQSDVSSKEKALDPGEDVVYYDVHKKYGSNIKWNAVKKMNPKDAFRSVYVYKTYQSHDEQYVIYSIFVSTIKAVEFIIRYTLEQIGIADYFDFAFLYTSEMMKTYKQYFTNKEVFPDSMIKMNLYFAKDSGTKSNVPVDKIFEKDDLVPADIRKSMIFYTVGDLTDFSEKRALMVSNPYDDEEQHYYPSMILNEFIEDGLRVMDKKPLESIMKYIYCLTERRDGTENKDWKNWLSKDNFKNNTLKVNGIAYNRFFDFANHEKIAIRANLNKENKFDSPTIDSIPATQLLNYALSIFVLRPYYWHTSKKPLIGQRYKKSIFTEKRMYSMSQMTWFDSKFVGLNRDNEKPKFIVFANLTPYTKKFGSGKSIDLFKSDCLEMQFVQVNMADNYMRISKIFSEEENNKDLISQPFIYLDNSLNKNVNKSNTFYGTMPIKSSIYGDNMLNLKDGKQKNDFLDNYVKQYLRNSFIYFETPEQFTQEYKAAYPVIWHDKDLSLDAYWEFYKDGEEVIKKGSDYLTILKQGNIEVFDGADERTITRLAMPHELQYRWSYPERYNMEEQQEDRLKINGITNYFGAGLQKLAFVIPAPLLTDKLDRKNMDFYNRNNNPYFGQRRAKYLSRLKADYYFTAHQYDEADSSETIFGQDDLVKNVDYHIAGVQEVWDLQSIKSGIEAELFYFDGLPDELRENIKLVWKPFRFKVDSIETAWEELLEFITFRNNEIERVEDFKVYNIDEIAQYCRNLIEVLEKLTKNGIEIYPATFDLYPDFYKIIEAFRNTKSNGNELIGVDIDFEKNKSMMVYVHKFFMDLFDFVKNPVTVSYKDIYNNNLKPPNSGTQIVANSGFKYNDTDGKAMELMVLNTFVLEILELSYIVNEFITSVLRQQTSVGNVFIPNAGEAKFRIGDYLNLHNDVLDPNIGNINLFLGANNVVDKNKAMKHALYTASKVAIRGAATAGGNAIGLLAANSLINLVDNRLEDIEEEATEDLRAPIDTTEAIYFSSINPYDINSRFGWFVWKTITYLGNSAGDSAAGTSGYTQKVYLCRDGVRFGGKVEEKDIIYELAQSLGGNVGNFNSTAVFNL